MKRRSADCSKLRRPLKRNRIAEGIYGRSRTAGDGGGGAAGSSAAPGPAAPRPRPVTGPCATWRPPPPRRPAPPPNRTWGAGRADGAERPLRSGGGTAGL